MIASFFRQPKSWAETDLALASEHLARDFARLPVELRRAIITLATQELKPAQGRETLLRRVTHYARECPYTIGTEAALAF